VSYVREEPPWFAFLVHPRDLDDFYRWPAGKILRRYSSSEEEFIAKTATIVEPVLLGEIVFGFEPIRGELVAVPRIAEDVLGPEGQKGIMAAVDLAALRGAPVLGLGGLIAPATGAGQRLLRRLPTGVTVTTGNAYTAAVSRRNVMEVCEAVTGTRKPRVAIVGASGSVGTAASLLLATEEIDLTLVGRSLRRLEAALGTLDGHAVLTQELHAIADADVVLMLTNDATAHLEPAMLKPGSVVIDVAQPSNVRRADRVSFLERDIRVVDGGLVRIPGLRVTYDFDVGDRETTFACLAETYLFAREGIRQHSVGRPTAEFALSMERLATRNRVVPVSLELEAA
jgi:fatty aldehyde-generating acyl-ACP reductase